jgi:hypothetical protein
MSFNNEGGLSMNPFDQINQGILRSILYCVSKIKHPINRDNLANILLGVRNSYIYEKKIDKSESFGSLNILTKHALGMYIEILIKNNLLSNNHISSNQSPIITITENGVKFLNGDITLDKSLYSSVIETKELTFDSKDEKLLSKLKSIRMQLASENKCAPYMICHDKTLFLIINKKPINKEQFLEIEGIRERSYNRFGEAFIKVIIESLEKDDSEENKVQDAKEHSIINEKISKLENILRYINRKGFEDSESIVFHINFLIKHYKVNDDSNAQNNASLKVIVDYLISKAEYLVAVDLIIYFNDLELFISINESLRWASSLENSKYKPIQIIQYAKLKVLDYHPESSDALNIKSYFLHDYCWSMQPRDFPTSFSFDTYYKIYENIRKNINNENAVILLWYFVYEQSRMNASGFIDVFKLDSSTNYTSTNDYFLHLEKVKHLTTQINDFKKFFDANENLWYMGFYFNKESLLDSETVRNTTYSCEGYELRHISYKLGDKDYSYKISNLCNEIFYLEAFFHQSEYISFSDFYDKYSNSLDELYIKLMNF